MRTWLVVVAVLGCGGAAIAPPPAPQAAPMPVELPSEPVVKPAGYVEVKPTDIVNGPDGAALLMLDEATELVLPIFIGGTEGHSIELRMRGASPQRPLTHDLLDDVVKKLRGSIVKVQIDELKDNVFHGSIYVRSGRRVLRLDARPSDAIALAIGNRIPIYCAEAVLLRAAVSRDEVTKQLAPGP